MEKCKNNINYHFNCRFYCKRMLLIDSKQEMSIGSRTSTPSPSLDTKKVVHKLSNKSPIKRLIMCPFFNI